MTNRSFSRLNRPNGCSDNVQYGELNYVWEAWLDFDIHLLDEEIIVNGTRGKSEEDWATKMQQAMSECFRVLKPGRWLSLCYHDTSEGTWASVQNVMKSVGFLVDDTTEALFIDTEQKSFNQRPVGSDLIQPIAPAEMT